MMRQMQLNKLKKHLLREKGFKIRLKNEIMLQDKPCSSSLFHISFTTGDVAMNLQTAQSKFVFMVHPCRNKS